MWFSLIAAPAESTCGDSPLLGGTSTPGFVEAGDGDRIRIGETLSPVLEPKQLLCLTFTGSKRDGSSPLARNDNLGAVRTAFGPRRGAEWRQ